MQPSRAPKKRAGPEPAAVHRGGRLGKSARRDVAWALRQSSETVKEIWVHGVKIVYVGKDVARGYRRDAQDAEMSPPANGVKKNARQRRSARRAKKYYSNLDAEKASENQTPSLEQRARAAGQYPPPPSPAPRAVPPTAPATSLGAQANGQGASADDDVSMTDVSGGGRGSRSGRGRGGSK